MINSKHLGGAMHRENRGWSQALLFRGRAFCSWRKGISVSLLSTFLISNLSFAQIPDHIPSGQGMGAVLSLKDLGAPNPPPCDTADTKQDYTGQQAKDLQKNVNYNCKMADKYHTGYVAAMIEIVGWTAAASLCGMACGMQASANTAADSMAASLEAYSKIAPGVASSCTALQGAATSSKAADATATPAIMAISSNMAIHDSNVITSGTACCTSESAGTAGIASVACVGPFAAYSAGPATAMRATIAEAITSTNALEASGVALTPALSESQTMCTQNTAAVLALPESLGPVAQTCSETWAPGVASLNTQVTTSHTLSGTLAALEGSTLVAHHEQVALFKTTAGALEASAFQLSGDAKLASAGPSACWGLAAMTNAENVHVSAQVPTQVTAPPIVTADVALKEAMTAALGSSNSFAAAGDSALSATTTALAAKKTQEAWKTACVVAGWGAFAADITGAVAVTIKDSQAQAAQPTGKDGKPAAGGGGGAMNLMGIAGPEAAALYLLLNTEEKKGSCRLSCPWIPLGHAALLALRVITAADAYDKWLESIQNAKDAAPASDQKTQIGQIGSGITGGPGSSGGGTTPDATAVHSDPSMNAKLAAANNAFHVPPGSISQGAAQAGFGPALDAFEKTTGMPRDELAKQVLSGKNPLMIAAEASQGKTDSGTLNAWGTANSNKELLAKSLENSSLAKQISTGISFESASKKSGGGGGGGSGMPDLSALMAGLLPQAKKEEKPQGPTATTFGNNANAKANNDGFLPADKSLFEAISMRYSRITTGLLNGDTLVKSSSTAPSSIPKNIYLKH